MYVRSLYVVGLELSTLVHGATPTAYKRKRTRAFRGDHYALLNAQSPSGRRDPSSKQFSVVRGHSVDDSGALEGPCVA